MARVVVVGAGIGGLTAALLLALRGHEVTLFEAGEAPGGKMRSVRVGGGGEPGVDIDAGPTVFTMRWVLDEVLAEAGLRLEDLVQLQPLSILARHAWRACAQTLDLYASEERSADAIGRFAGAAEARRFRTFSAEAAKVYACLEAPHIRSGRPTLMQMAGDLGPQGLARLARLGPLASLWRSLSRHFHDARLQQLFGRYATYCGSSPWAAPATLCLVAHVEMAGVWSIGGGMAMLAQRLAGLCAARGVRLRYGQPVQRLVVEHRRVAAVVLGTGDRHAADAVVFNGDVQALAQGLLGADAVRAVRPAARRAPRSLSAVTWLMHLPTGGFPLTRHNVFFDADYAAEFDDIFRRRRLPRQPTVYLCAQDRVDDAPVAAGQAERLLALVNAPATDASAALDPTEISSCEQRAFHLLANCGLEIDPSRRERITLRTPADFARLYPASNGALYGPALHGWMALFKRAAAATPIPGLYLAGGSVHPGPGVPMAAMSGRLAAATLQAGLDSISRSRRVHIAGGMSMRSATTAATP